MKIDKRTIEAVSRLAKISLLESEKESYITDFKEILSAFKTLDSIDVSSVKSSFKPVEEKNAMRDDKITKGISQKEALQYTCYHERGFFVGPKTIR